MRAGLIVAIGAAGGGAVGWSCLGAGGAADTAGAVAAGALGWLEITPRS